MDQSEDGLPTDSAAVAGLHDGLPKFARNATDMTTSSLSELPATDPAAAEDAKGAASETPQLSAQTEEILKRINVNAANAVAAGTPEWEAAKEQIMKDMAMSDKFPTTTPSQDQSAPKHGGRGGRGANSTRNGITEGDSIAVKVNGDGTPAKRGRGGGRPRGRGRGAGRGGKRKREDDDDGASDSSEVYTPIATTTKSGRSVQKPTSFVPPPPASPATTTKRKRTGYRRNPESAVCKMCLRGTSPASNMIVFCDGCNTPYHRYCHHPPIDQSVIDEVDKEWYCKQCEKERVLPVPDAEVAEFVSAEGAPMEQRQRYFSSLPQGLLVTLLTKATTIHPDLPVFGPDFQARITNDTKANPTSTTNGHAHPPPKQASKLPTSAMAPPNGSSTAGATSIDNAEDEEYADHPPNYPRPGHGLMKTLPPEQEDLQWLVDDDDRFGVFSHIYQTGDGAAPAGGEAG